MADELTPPRPGPVDAGYNLARGIIGAVPFGSIAVEVIGWFLAPPIERRKAQWAEELADVLRDLQENRGLQLEDLQANDQFIDVVLQATQIAARTSQAEKRAALCNAVANAALQESMDASRQQMLLNFIDVFTPWHLKLLDLFDDPLKWAAGHDHKFPNVMSGSLKNILVSAYPDVDQTFASTIWFDMNMRGLVFPDTLGGMISGRGLLERRTTGLGREFLRFIREPAT